MENVQKQREYPSTQQVNMVLAIVNKRIRESLEAKEFTYDDLNSHLIVLTFQPSWANKEFTMIYSYPFNNIERNTPKGIVNGFLDCKENFKLQFIE